MYSNPQIKLAYVLSNFTGFIDAVSGKNIDYTGNEVVKAPQNITFTDIKNNKYYADIQQLIDMGIIEKNNDKFAPDSKILQKDFIKILIKSIEQNVYPIYMSKVGAGMANSDYDTYYQQAIQKNIITAAEKKPDATITRLDAAKLIIKTLNLGYLAKVDGLYRVSI